MAAPYTRAFGRVKGTFNQDLLVYTPLSGYTNVLRNLTVYINTTDAKTLTIYVLTGGVIFPVLLLSSTSDRVEHVETRIVLEVGDVLRASSSGINWSVVATGFLLKP